jgi:hypothetical protein
LKQHFALSGLSLLVTAFGGISSAAEFISAALAFAHGISVALVIVAGPQRDQQSI